MHDKFKFLSLVADPWMEVYNGSMLPEQLRKLEVFVVSRLGLKIPAFTPVVPILLLFRRMFLLSGDVQLRIFMLTPIILHCKPIKNAFDWFMLIGDMLSRGISTREFSRNFVTVSMPPPMTTAGTKSTTLTDKLQTMLTMRVSSIGSFLGSFCLLESLIVYLCSSDS